MHGGGKSLDLRIKEVTRIEGHGNIVIDIRKGKVRELRLEIVESPRFFEVMLKGRSFEEAQHIMSRICGICGVSHTTASLKAVEAAMGIKVSRQAELLRRLAFCGENYQSHLLHLFFLVFPDLLGVGSVAPLLKTHPKLVHTGLELKRIANEINTVVAGRFIHPISLFPGGVVYTPKRGELKELKGKLLGSLEALEYTFGFLSLFPFPDFKGPKEFIALKKKGEFAIYDGAPTSSKKYSIRPDQYTKKIKEYIVPHSTSKHAVSPRGTFMVGALARINLSFRNLRPMAIERARKAGLTPPVHNPFMNNMAQLVECFHLVEEAVFLIDMLLEMGPKPEPIKKPKVFGRGVGIVEAPRGTLFHDYTINKDGIVEKADCVIPTAQNLRSMEEDLRAFVPTILDRPREEIKRSVETLVRAYDPCISCSTHIMDVRFV